MKNKQGNKQQIHNLKLNPLTKAIHQHRALMRASILAAADANTGWTRHEAARVVNAVADLDVYIEQPCMTYEESVSIRRRTSLPFILDEVIDGTDTLVRGISEDAMDVINLKISKVGGLTRAKLMRDRIETQFLYDRKTDGGQDENNGKGIDKHTQHQR